MKQESGYVGGVPKMATGAEAFLEDAGCWQASLQNARELLEAAGARERARVGGSGRRVDCPRAWLAPGSPEEGTTPRPAKEEALSRTGPGALAGSAFFKEFIFNEGREWNLKGLPPKLWKYFLPGGSHYAFKARTVIMIYVYGV